MLPPVTFPPDLGPLRNSAAFDAVERDLKQLTIDLFTLYLRPRERDINVYGAPHLGSFDLIERNVTRDGLALYRKADQAAMRYLYRAWKAQNPKRGLHVLRTYVQLLWPNANSVDQLWQKKADPYPTNLVTRQEIAGDDPHATHYRTSRVHVSVDEPEEDGQGLLRVLPSLRSVIAARFLLLIFILRRFENTGDHALGFVNGASMGIHAFYEGEATLP